MTPGTALKIWILSGLLLAGIATETARAQTLAEKIESLSLATRARLSLMNDDALKPYALLVAAEGSALRVSGRVKTQEEWARAAAILERLQGVSAVVNEITLLDGSEPEESDLIAVDDLEDEEVEALDPMMVLEWDSLDAARAAAPPPESEPVPTVIYKIPEGYHLVDQGETLLRISERYGITIRDLREYNNLAISDRPEPGQLLRVRPLGSRSRD